MPNCRYDAHREAIQRLRQAGVGGIDEACYPLAEHIAVFREAAARGLGMTAHAGEAAGAGNVREVV